MCLYFSISLPIAISLWCLKCRIGSPIQHLIFGSVTITAYISMHILMQRIKELHKYTCILMNLILGFYVTEVCRMAGSEHINNISFALFAYSTCVCINLNQDWKLNSFGIAGSLFYYYTRLCIYFKEVPYFVIFILIISSLFYIINIYSNEENQKLDHLIVSKYSDVHLSTIKLLDFIPYPILVEDGRQILFFNSKLIEFLDIPIDEIKSININLKIERKIRETNIKILSYKENSPSQNTDIFLKNESKIEFNPKEETKELLSEDNSSVKSSLSITDQEALKTTNVNIDLCLSELLVKYTSYKLSLSQNKSIPRSSLIKLNKNSDEAAKKDEITIQTNNKQYVIKHQIVNWIDGNAILHILEETNSTLSEPAKSHIDSKFEKQKSSLKLISNKLQDVLKSTSYELSEVLFDEPKFKGLKRSVRTFSSLISKIISIISGKEIKFNESEDEEITFKMRDLCNEVYNTVSSLIEEKKLDYIQTINPDLENLEINMNK